LWPHRATDFFSIEVLTWTGLVRHFVLFLMDELTHSCGTGVHSFVEVSDTATCGVAPRHCREQLT
jgi:hypothetical protein